MQLLQIYVPGICTNGDQLLAEVQVALEPAETGALCPGKVVANIASDITKPKQSITVTHNIKNSDGLIILFIRTSLLI